jgi:hypothetical protein
MLYWHFIILMHSGFTTNVDYIQGQFMERKIFSMTFLTVTVWQK